MDKENVVYYTMEYYLVIKKNEIKLFARKWTEVQITYLAKTSHIQKESITCFCHTQNLDLK
jgi:hypothetical protein